MIIAAARQKDGSKQYPDDSTSLDEGLILMNLSLELIGADKGAATILSEGRLMAPFSCIPEEIKKKLSRRDKAGIPILENTPIHLGKDVYNLRVFVIQNGLAAQPILALYVQRAYRVNDPLEDIAVQYNLTARERETVKGISAGLTSKEMAERMNISPNTVKSFLRVIMLKMGTTTRSGIVSKLLEHSSHHISNIDIRRPILSKMENGLHATQSRDVE